MYLLVDDDEMFRFRLGKALERRGHVVYHAENVDGALEFVARQAVDRIVLDLRMPGGSGIDGIARLRAMAPDVRIVVLTGYGSIATTQTAIKRGAWAYLTKPCEVDRIIAAFNDEQNSDPVISAHPPSLAEVEWEHIQRVLSDVNGNVSHAAKILGLDRRSLQRRLAKEPARNV
jgi:two-component system response regulator RegA